MGDGWSDGVFLNDIWSSENGDSWQLITDQASWSARSGHAVVVFQDRLWLIGGFGSGQYHSDIWVTEDGETWHQVVADAPWRGRESHQVVVYQDALWIIGGSDGAPLSDVWRSEDGIEWERITHDAEFGPISEHQVVVYRDRMVRLVADLRNLPIKFGTVSMVRNGTLSWSTLCELSLSSQCCRASRSTYCFGWVQWRI